MAAGAVYASSVCRDTGSESGIGRIAKPRQAPGAGGEFSDAAALEFSPADAQSKHEFLSGRVCRPRSGQGYANRACVTRCLFYSGRHTRLCDDLFFDADCRGGEFQSLDVDTFYRVADPLYLCITVFCAANEPGFSIAGRRAGAHDGAHQRRLHQHCHRQALLSCRQGSGLRKIGHAGVSENSAWPDAIDHRF